MNKNENKKSLKKPLILGGIAVLLTLIGVAGGNTYAKYITSKTVSAQTATVAKFGFVINANADDLFSNKYGLKDGSTVEMVKKADGAGVVASSSVVAPGTEGSMTFEVVGFAEVEAKLKFDMTMGSEIAFGGYKPIKWTLSSKATADGTYANVADCADLSLKDIVDKVNNLSEASIAANTNVNMYYQLSWSWAFEQGATDAEKLSNNMMDTLLGYKAAGKAWDDIKNQSNFSNAYNAELYNNAVTLVDLALGITVEQVAK